MKKLIRFIPLLFILFAAQSCVKSVVVANGSSPVAGRWVLTESSQYTNNGWQYFNTGLEPGVFTFNNDGSARYEDNANLMTGNWYVQILSAGYYDEYDNYYTDSHQSLSVSLYDNYTRTSVDLYFDYAALIGNKMIGTNYYNGVLTKYVFRRY